MVVVNGGRIRKVTAYPVAGTPQNLSSAPAEMSARAVLTSCPNSHPFQERTLILDTPAKVGRSVARARAASNNAIFDCKVLSRHHALLWYENGKFFLQDTKSSNGTFVNNSRLSECGKESAPREIFSGNVVQFGVDVVENNRRVTHGCIIATLRLYLPDGKEAKPSQATLMGSFSTGGPDELYRLAQHLREAAHREQQLESKFVALQRLVEQAKQGAELGWRAAVDEDRLLSRVAILESQLGAYSKTCSEDTLREELIRLQRDKDEYQIAAKDSLEKLHKARLDAIDKVTVLERATITAEEERTAAIEQCVSTQEELRKLAVQLADSQKLTTELTEKLADAKADGSLRSKLEEFNERERVLNLRLDTIEGFVLNPNMLEVLRTELTLAQEQLALIEEKNFKNSEEVTDELSLNIPNIEARTTCEKIQEQIEVLEKILPQSVIDKALLAQRNNREHDVDIDHSEMIASLEEKLKSQIESTEQALCLNQELREKIMTLEQELKENRNEAQQLRDKLNPLIVELESRPKHLDLEDKLNLVRKSQDVIKNLENENKSLKDELTRLSHTIGAGDDHQKQEWVELARLTDLEDELVILKEKHAQCEPNRTRLEQDLANVRDQLNQFSSRSQTVLFYYVAPLILAIIYLLVSPKFA